MGKIYTRGGKRKGAGRPKNEGEKKVSRTYSTYDSFHIKIKKRYGSIFKALKRLIEIDK